MEVKNETSGIWSEIKKLGNNTLYPAAFVVAGTIGKHEYQVAAASLQKAGVSPFDTATTVLSNWAKSAWNGLTVENAKSFGSDAVDLAHSSWTSISNRSLEGSVKSIATSLSKYHVEMGTAAAIGASATVIDAFLKKIPGVNRFGFLRVPTSIGLASAAVYAGANYGLNLKVNPAMLLDIAVKVGVVGLAWKATTQITAVGLRILGPVAFLGCEGTANILEKVSFGEWPSNATSASKKDVRKVQVSQVLSKEDVAPPKQATPKKQAAAVAEQKEDVAPKKPATPKKQAAAVGVQNDDDGVLNISADDPNLIEDQDGKQYYLCPNQEDQIPQDAIKYEGKWYMPVGNIVSEQGEAQAQTPKKQQAEEYKVSERGRRVQGTPKELKTKNT